MYLQILLTLYISHACALPTDSHAWEDYKIKFGKKYSSVDEPKRREIWRLNVRNIDKHNSKPKKSYIQGMNNFTDMTHDEFLARIGISYKIPQKDLEGNQTQKGFIWLPLSNVKLPNEVDWRKAGYVTPVKNQGVCGSGWAFSTTGALEGQMMKKIGQLGSLSEQNLIDCSRSFGNTGCDGGLMDNAFTYIRDNKGIDSEFAYPYTGVESDCNYNPVPGSAAAYTNGFVDLPNGDENILTQVVATVGPVSVAIDASNPSFMFYRDGVYNEQACGNAEKDLTHGMLAVGYGTEIGGSYWIVKNSWGNSWGSDGYVKIARNDNNLCGIATKASYPLV